MSNIFFVNPNINNVTPKAQTTLAPVGKSRKYDIAMPNALTIKPIIQPIISLVFALFEKRMAQVGGTIRNANTTSTPAIFTELVTTKPNET